MISIIIPALNESANIKATLASVQSEHAHNVEIIVVDGGSDDCTTELATAWADQVILAPRGRASQMNAGAARARADVLLFLHADSLLPKDGLAALSDGLAQSGRRWGRFDVTITGKSRWLKHIAWWMNRRSRLTGVATGDQGIFVRRELFEAVEGFPAIALMEDIALSKQLKRAAGRGVALSARIVTSGRRWERQGLWRTIMRMWRLRLAFALGTDPRRLARAYDA